MERQSIHDYISGTHLNFARVRSLENHNASVVIHGIPFDLGVTDIPGARFAPWKIREESIRFMGEVPSMADAGNLSLPLNFSLAMEMIEEVYKNFLKNEKRVLTLGGDHSITRPILNAYKSKYPLLKVIHLDAHPDRTEPSFGNHHGTIFFKENESRILSLGLRYPEWKNADLHLGKVKDFLGNDPYYLTLDIDVVDPGFAPGVSTAVPGGILPRELLEFIQGLPRNCLGGDIVECNPNLDVNSMTARLCAWAMIEISKKVI